MFKKIKPRRFMVALIYGTILAVSIVGLLVSGNQILQSIEIDLSFMTTDSSDEVNVEEVQEPNNETVAEELQGTLFDEDGELITYYYEFEDESEALNEKLKIPELRDKYYLSKEWNSDFEPYYVVSSEKTKYIYNGEIKNDLPHGTGIIYQSTYSEGTSSVYTILYVGHYNEGYYDGYGVLFDPATAILDDTEDEMLAKSGAYYLFYSGEFEKGLMMGKGNIYYPDFDYDIEEYLLDNEKEVQSILSDFYSGIDHDIISYMPPMESIIYYSGGIRDGYEHGKGTTYTINQEVYHTGGYKDGLFHGQGVSYDSDGNVVHIGTWEDGTFVE